AETNATHVFVVSKGEVATSRTLACPEGITRTVVLELCRRPALPPSERALALTEVYRADEVFCTGTMGEIAPVTKIDGRTIGDGGVGPVGRRRGFSVRQPCARRG